MFEDLNRHKYLHLLEIEENDESEFRLVVAEAAPVVHNENLSADETDQKVLDVLEGARPIEITDGSRFYEIIFEDYISYSVINESFDNTCGGIYTGNLARIYDESTFLDYV